MGKGSWKFKGVFNLGPLLNTIQADPQADALTSFLTINTNDSVRNNR